MNLLITNALVLPMTAAGEEPKSCRAAVGVAGNRIALLSNDEARIEAFRREYAPHEIDATGKLLMPGLINTHCHTAMTLQRSYADDIALMRWLHEYIWPFEAKQTPDEIETGAELGIVEMLLGGTTSFVDMYWHADRTAAAVRRLGARAMLGVCYLDSNFEEFEPSLQRTLAAAEGCDRIGVVVAPHAPYTCSRENLLRGQAIADRLGLMTTIHVAETEDEARIVEEQHGCSPVQYLDSLGLLNERTIGAHCIWLDDRDIATLRDRRVIVAHNPQSNMKIASGIAPLSRLHAEGVCCTIATDGVCSNNDLDLWEEMRSASFLQKVATMDPCVLPAYEMLKMVTVHAARAMGHDGELGVVREGALADLILIDLNKPHLCPVHDPVANLVYCGKASDVDTVIVDGEVVVEGRTVRGVDLPDLMRRVQVIAESIVSR